MLRSSRIGPSERRGTPDKDASTRVDSAMMRVKEWRTAERWRDGCVGGSSRHTLPLASASGRANISFSEPKHRKEGRVQEHAVGHATSLGFFICFCRFCAGEGLVEGRVEEHAAGHATSLSFFNVFL